MEKKSEKDLRAIVKELADCATVCEQSVLELQQTSLNDLKKIIAANKGCAETCRRSILLFEEGKKTASAFLTISTKEVCADCEAENKKFNHDACKKSAIACRHLIDFIKNYN